METGFRQQLSSELPTSPVRRVTPSRAQRSSPPPNEADDKQVREQEAAMRREEQRVVQELAARDREVRAHEAAHLAVGREYVVSGPSYTYQQGPNGRNYAIGGEVTLDVSEEDKPQSTLDKAETVRRAALAPAEPSAQDRQVAARAAQMAAQARVAIAVERRDATQANQSGESETTRSAQPFDMSVQTETAQQVNVYA